MSSNVKYFDDPDESRTVAFEVGERKFWVSREILAAYSPVFKAMFYGQFVESAQKIIPLPGKDPKDIEELLLCLIPTPEIKPIDKSNMGVMMALADEYDIKDLRARVESFVMLEMKNFKDKEVLMDILHLASKHGLRRVLDPCLQRCAWKFDEFDFDHPDLPKAVVDCLYLYKKVKRQEVEWEDLSMDCDCWTEGMCVCCEKRCVCCQKRRVHVRCPSCSDKWCNSCADQCGHHHCTKRPIDNEDAKRMQEIVKILLDHM